MFRAVLLALTIALCACGDDSPGGGGDGPIFRVLDPGVGDPNGEDLWPMAVGMRRNDSVVAGISHAGGGLDLYRFVQPPTPTRVPGVSNPPSTSWYSDTAHGLGYHGSTAVGFVRRPMLLVPDEVRVGMAWETTLDEDLVRFEVVERNLVATVWGERVVWTIRQFIVDSGALDTEWRWVEGVGPDGAEVGVLPHDPQTGIDADTGALAAGEAVQGSDGGPFLVQGPTDGYAHASVVAGAGGAAQVHLQPRPPEVISPGLCLRLLGDAVSVIGFDSLTLGDVAEGACPSLPWRIDPSQSVAGSHAALAVLADDGVHWARGGSAGTVEQTDYGTTFRANYFSTLDLDGRVATLSHEVSRAGVRRANFATLDSDETTTPVVMRWASVDQVRMGHPALFGDLGPARTVPLRVDPTAGAPLVLSTGAGVWLASTFDGRAIGAADLAFFLPGNAHYRLDRQGRQVLVTSPDGLVHRIDARDGSLTLTRVAQLDVVLGDSLVAAFQLELDGDVAVLTATANVSCSVVGCDREHRLQRVPAIAQPDRPPPSASVSSTLDGLDAFVCWPRAFGPPSMASGWTLGGRAPVAVVEEPEAAGSCVLLVRDVSETPDLSRPDAFLVEGTVPGVGRVTIAHAMSGEGPQHEIDSFSNVSDQPPSVALVPYAPTGGFVSNTARYGRSGVLVSQADNRVSDDLEPQYRPVQDLTGRGLWGFDTFEAMRTPWGLVGGPGVPPPFDVPYRVTSTQMASARGGVVLCPVRAGAGGGLETCLHLHPDGALEDRPELAARRDRLPWVELADGTVCYDVVTGSVCVRPDGAEVAHPERLPTGQPIALPSGDGWFVGAPGAPGVSFYDAGTGTSTPLWPGCWQRPARANDGTYWAVLERDAEGGCFGPRRDLEQVVARLTPTGIEPVDVPMPKDVYGDPEQYLEGVVPGDDVLLLLAGPGDRPGTTAASRMHVYRVPAP